MTPLNVFGLWEEPEHTESNSQPSISEAAALATVLQYKAVVLLWVKKKKWRDRTENGFVQLGVTSNDCSARCVEAHWGSFHSQTLIVLKVNEVFNS